MSKLENKINDCIDKFIPEGISVGASIGVTKDNKTLLIRNYGNVKQTINNNNIGSLTKTITSYNILFLIDEKKLKLSTKLHKFYPQIPNSKKIKIFNLLNMTSGIHDYTTDDDWINDYYENPYQKFIPEEIINTFATKPSNFCPGTQFLYTNSNYIILGRIIEKITGQKLEYVFHVRIFKPLNMFNTRFPKCGKPVNTNIGFTYERDILDESTNWNVNWAYGTGNINSDVDDLLKWAPFMGKGKNLSKKLRKLRIAPFTADLTPNTPHHYYGLGIGINGNWSYHGGSIPGYESVIAYERNMDLSIVVLVNTNNPPDKANQQSLAHVIFEKIIELLEVEDIGDNELNHDDIPNDNAPGFNNNIC